MQISRRVGFVYLFANFLFKDDYKTDRKYYVYNKS